eukprot:s7034_g3.t1
MDDSVLTSAAGQPPPCPQAPQDRPVGCFPGNPGNVPGCNATNWDSRPSANCYEADGLNVLDIWLRNRACRAGIFTTLTEVQVTLDGDVGPIPDCDVSSDLRVCFYVPGFGTASNWVANAIYNFGAVSPQCVAVFTTAEIVLVELVDLVFKRTYDDATGFEELKVLPREAETAGYSPPGQT